MSSAVEREYICAIDTGGTFTDCVVIDKTGRRIQAKSPTTAHDFREGVFAALGLAANELRISVGDLLAATDQFLVGTTVATNAVVERSGARVGAVLTRGHRDVLDIMRGHGRVAGRPLTETLAPYRTYKPAPLVARADVVEIAERVDSLGEVVVTLDRESVREAASTLSSKGVEAVAVCFLWSFANPEHEETAREIVSSCDPTLFVCTSSEVAPKWGEYERWTAAVINAYLGPIVSLYIDGISAELAEHGYEGQFLIMTCNGGSLPAEKARRLPILLIGSGPVGGLSGSTFLSRTLDHAKVIAADMGGTSFDVGLIHEFEAIRVQRNQLGGYEYYAPSVEVRSIGSGGGSIAWADPVTDRLCVGPRSAGAHPGPACYGRGGLNATVTDANLILGLINPHYFLGGAMTLDVDAARRAVAGLGEALGLSNLEVASGIVRITDSHMTDLLRRMTIEKGFHPADFVLYSYGGAGGLHASSFARELGASTVVIPLSESASVWSAFGVGTSDILHVYEATEIGDLPVPAARLNARLEHLEARGRAQLAAEGVAPHAMSLQRLALLRYGLQVNELAVPLPARELTDADVEEAVEAFETAYEERYGRGSGYRGAGFELVSLVVEATGRIRKPALRSADRGRGPARPHSSRAVYWSAPEGLIETPIYRVPPVGDDVVRGPAVIELLSTTVAVRPGDSCRGDEFGNIWLEVAPQ